MGITQYMLFFYSEDKIELLEYHIHFDTVLEKLMIYDLGDKYKNASQSLINNIWSFLCENISQSTSSNILDYKYPRYQSGEVEKSGWIIYPYSR